MENFTVEMRIANLTGGEFIVVDALVGTGSSLTALPGSLLRHLGVEEKCLRRFKLADGQVVEYPVGQARVRLAGQEGIVMVVFAPDDFNPRIGKATRSILCLEVDPAARRLVPVLPRMCDHPFPHGTPISSFPIP
jgi:predicted aspartyl protease